MPYDEDQIANLEAEVDDLVTPTTEDVLAYSQDYDAGIVAASALQKSLNGGGGGGGSFNGGTITESLSIEPTDPGFDASFQVVGAEDQVNSLIHVESFDGNVFDVGPTGAVTISPSDTDVDPLTVPGFKVFAGGRTGLQAPEGFPDYGAILQVRGNVADLGSDPLVRVRSDSDDVLVVGPTGAVTISPPDTSAFPPLTIKGGTDAGVNFDTLVNIKDDADQYVFQVDAAGDMYVNLRQDGAEFVVSGNASNLIHATRDGADDKLGFFGVAAAAQPTGVAVDAAGIHAALVTLGLITA